MAIRIVRVEDVVKDNCGWPVLVRIQYIKDGKLLHDAVFTRNKKKRVVLTEKRMDNYIPPKRYQKMFAKAAAVMFKKKLKPAVQQELPFKK